MAIIDKGRVLLTGEPLRAHAALEGRVWQKAIARSDLDAVKAAQPVISTRLLAGRTLVNVVSDDAPGDGFEPVEADARGRLLRRDRAAGWTRRPLQRRRPDAQRTATIAAFELRSRLRRISTWVYFVGLLRAGDDVGRRRRGRRSPGAIVSFGSGKVWVNSPYAIAQTIALLGMAAVTVIAAVMGRAVQQDFEYRTERSSSRAPIRKWEYLGGRFAGRVAVLLVILSSIALGGAAGAVPAGHRSGPRRPVPPARLCCCPTRRSCCRISSSIGGALLLPRRADAADAARLHRQRALPDRLPRRAGPAARHGQQGAGGDARSVRRRRQRRA